MRTSKQPYSCSRIISWHIPLMPSLTTSEESIFGTGEIPKKRSDITISR